MKFNEILKDLPSKKVSSKLIDTFNNNISRATTSKTTNISSLVDLDKRIYYSKLPLELKVAYDITYGGLNTDDILKKYDTLIKSNDSVILRIVGNDDGETSLGVQMFRAVERDMEGYKNTLYSVYYDMK